LHYASVPSQPIEVDDEVAAALVEAGDLAPYQPGIYVAPRLGFDPRLGWVGDAELAESGRQAGEAFAEGLAGEAADIPNIASDPEKPAPRSRSRRSKSSED
jgi:hypothetical protein